MTNYRERIIVALDKPTLQETEKLLQNLKGSAGFYKIGLELFTAHGWDAVDLVSRHGGRIFLDLKLHDIPNTVTQTIRAVCRHAIEMVNVHTLGGLEMMKGAAGVIQELDKTGGKKPKILGVTILTSHSQATLKDELQIQQPVAETVRHLTTLAKQAGLDGVVCSPQELPDLRKTFSAGFCLVTPGIRPQGSEVGDQVRISTPEAAFAAGADYLVIGRPITQAADPKSSFEAILASVSRP